MGELDGEWEVRRLSGALPPLYGVHKRIDGTNGETLLGPLHSPFAVVGHELRYEGRLSRGLVDSVEPGKTAGGTASPASAGEPSAASPCVASAAD